ncbi:MAG TPA: hypothetical protein VFA68_21685 [Terriglobales bacterium]|nr:hypothetical protein [Terriglobales bacterium]
MEGLAHLVTQSLKRHNFEPALDHRRLQWSRWFRCESSFDLLLVPSKPGLFALGEEVIAPDGFAGKRMLALFQLSETDDLGMTLGRMFLPGNPLRERFASCKCFARYVVIEDASQRRAACESLQQWMASSAESASGISVNMQTAPFDGGVSHPVVSAQEPQAEITDPTPLPDGF